MPYPIDRARLTDMIVQDISENLDLYVAQAMTQVSPESDDAHLTIVIQHVYTICLHKEPR